MNAPFRPSDVVISLPPLCGTLGKAEIEYAVAMVVRTLAATDDTWRGVSWGEIQGVMRADLAAARDPFSAMLRNPFFRPDIHAAVAAGHAIWDGDEGSGPVRLTLSAVDALRKWVKP
jgi:hypothetical protein